MVRPFLLLSLLAVNIAGETAATGNASSGAACGAQNPRGRRHHGHSHRHSRHRSSSTTTTQVSSDGGWPTPNTLSMSSSTTTTTSSQHISESSDIPYYASSTSVNSTVEENVTSLQASMVPNEVSPTSILQSTPSIALPLQSTSDALNVPYNPLPQTTARSVQDTPPFPSSSTSSDANTQPAAQNSQQAPPSVSSSASYNTPPQSVDQSSQDSSPSVSSGVLYDSSSHAPFQNSQGPPPFVSTTEDTTMTTASTPSSMPSIVPSFAAPSAAPSSPTAGSAQGVLPNTNTLFSLEKGSKWSIQKVGDIGFTGLVASKTPSGDKCRTSKIGQKIFWSCGDMMCQPDVESCGFSMGPSFFATDSVMTIDTTDVENMGNATFVQPWSGDAPPQSPYQIWGMDNSNVAPINDTHGVVYSRAIWRGAPDGSHSDRGNAVAAVTLGDSNPIATRIGPYLTGPDVVELGLLAVLRDADYVYVYSMGGPSKITVSRVQASDDVFDRSKYESLVLGSDGQWQQGLPLKTDTTHGMVTAEPSKQFACDNYGSIFYNNYLKKYTIVCTIFMSFTNMYLSDTPWGPWSSQYSLLAVPGYGSHAHPEFSPGGSHKVWYFSQGPNGPFDVYKVDFSGYQAA